MNITDIFFAVCTLPMIPALQLLLLLFLLLSRLAPLTPALLLPAVHRGHVPFERESGAEDPTAELAGRRPKVAAVDASLVLAKGYSILYLFAALVTGVAGGRHTRHPPAPVAHRRRHNPVPGLHVAA